MTTLLHNTQLAFAGINRLLAPLFSLAVRLWIAQVFFKSALTKIDSWSTTLALFEHEYDVPLLSPAVAASLGTAVEVVAPLLLAIGLGTRASAAILFAFNLIAAVSYPDISEAGILQHQYWGILLTMIFVYGPGKLSLDALLCARYPKLFR